MLRYISVNLHSRGSIFGDASTVANRKLGQSLTWLASQVWLPSLAQRWTARSQAPLHSLVAGPTDARSAGKKTGGTQSLCTRRIQNGQWHSL